MSEAFEVTSATYIAIAATGLALLVYSTIGGLLDRLSISSAMFFAIAGILVGPLAFNLVPADSTRAVIRVYVELALAILLCAQAARQDFRVLIDRMNFPLRLICVALPLTIILGFVSAMVFLPEIGWLEAAIIAVILAPTDADLAKPVTTSEKVPDKVSVALETESGLNDGICVPLILALSAAALSTMDVGWTAAGEVGQLLTKEIGIGVLVGCSIATAFLLFARGTKGRHFVDGSRRLFPFLALALTSFGTAQVLEGSGFIAAFAAGICASFEGQRRRFDLVEASEGVADLLSGLTWISFGIVLFPHLAGGVSLGAVIYAAASLTFVRIVPVFLSLSRCGMNWAEKTFIGWFGPRGLASVAFAILIIDREVIDWGSLAMQTIVLTVTLSVVLHGISARLGAQALGKLS